ncbi:hypothetical protein HK097_003257 [Rhizophlyctis rosea]|uniref:Uncharacterized protein n=1 Tax=Rhizophlyctis rosea TaxID=64517 RepID=A0AAD5SHZ6_9FUNG|nr:hypothetical protein HK097_003257 [Rhizophlyctis rosea]
MNLKRTVEGYARAGCAGIMLEDQTSPKRCGHTKNKSVVSREEAYTRIKAAVDARTAGTDIFILARTDARIIGLEEAITRCKEFRRLGADMTFLEAPLSIEEMRAYCSQVDGPKMANMLEHGKTPILPGKELRDIGYVLAAYPLTLLSAAMKSMVEVLKCLKSGNSAGVESRILPFSETCRLVGFEEYWEEEKRYDTTAPAEQSKPDAEKS